MRRLRDGPFAFAFLDLTRILLTQSCPPHLPGVRCDRFDTRKNGVETGPGEGLNKFPMLHQCLTYVVVA